MRNTSNFSFKKRLRIYMRDVFTCRYCERAMNPLSDDLALDHIAPDGGSEDSNLVTCCRSCNSRKGSRTPEAWRASTLDGANDGRPSPAEVLASVAAQYGVAVKRLSSPNRDRHSVDARIQAARRLREECLLSLKQIGHLLGGRDHSTIINLLRGGKRRKIPQG